MLARTPVRTRIDHDPIFGVVLTRVGSEVGDQPFEPESGNCALQTSSSAPRNGLRSLLVTNRTDRFGGGTHCHLVGKHCESGDVIVRDANLADPRPGDLVVTPATGGYGHSMANNYNGVPRPPPKSSRS